MQCACIAHCLCFVYNPETLIDSGILSPFSNLDHYPIFATFNTKLPIQPKISKTIWDYQNLDADQLTQILINTNWQNIIDKDIDSAIEEFTSTLLDAARLTIPTKTVTIRHRDKPWVTADLKRQIRKRDRLFKKARNSQTNYDWERWRQQRNIATSMTRQLKKQHILKQVSTLLENKQNPHKYYQTLRNITGRKQNHSIPPLETADRQTLTDDKDKATLLNQFFAAQSNLNIPDTQPIHATPQNLLAPTLSTINVTGPEILKILNSLDANKSTGPDQLPVKIIKLTAIIIAEPLAKLFNKSLQQGIFPKSWKLSDIKPIFKNKGSASNVSNYRPISLLPCLSKVLEKIVFKNIYQHLTDHQLLTDKQSGY